MTEITLEWASAEVTAAGVDLALRIPLCARPDPDWLREFEGLRVSRHLEARGNAWMAEPVDERNAIRVLRVIPGDESAIREALNEMVSLASARAEQCRAEEAARERREQELLAQARQQAAEMTERFRSTAPTRASSIENVATEHEHGFQHRLRVFGAGREEAPSDPAHGPPGVRG